jgi:AcrR family transcriptional regulator
MPRHHRPATRERIVEAALALIDADGLAALSTRRLAAALGVQGPSLYNHFATKVAILDAVADSVTATVDVTFFARCDWREALRRWAWSYREALTAHPNIVPYLAQGPGRRPAALTLADAVYGGLVKAGWPPARATHIGAAMRYFVAGRRSPFAHGFVEIRSCTPPTTAPTGPGIPSTSEASTRAAWAWTRCRTDWRRCEELPPGGQRPD